MLRILCLLALSALLVSSIHAAPLSLAAGGKTAYVIVLDPSLTAPPDADGKPVVTPEQHAANELASFLKQVTGAEFPVIITADKQPGPMLVVGPGAVQKALAPNLKLDNLKADGIVIESVGPNLIFAGDKPRGTLYAVYTFLEDTVGCRWWSSKASTIPSKPALTVPEQHVRYIPPLEYREPFWFDGFDPDWAVRNKSNGHATRLDAQRGGKTVYAGSFVHTFNSLVPPATYGKEHPEWFSERDGKRIVTERPDQVQLCVTNPELKDFVVQQVFKRIEAYPTCTIISVSQNDFDAHCLCAECKKLEEYEGSPSGPLLHLVNYVAERVAQKYPNVAVDTLAYQYTRKPPLHVKPLPNVIVRLCSIECDFLNPLTAPSNQTFADDIRGWSKICQRLYIWDYTTNFAHYIQPHPNLRVLGPNIRFFVENGVKGIFEQGGYQSPGGEMGELREWVMAKLLWNPKQDDQKLVQEFIAGYFGPAAPYISQYVEAVYESAVKTNTNLTIWVPPTSAYLSFDLMGKSEALFNQAEAAVKNDPDLLNRVQVARLPVRYVWSVRWHEFQAYARKHKVAWPGPADYLENAKTFMATATANKVTKLSEGRGIESFSARIIDLGRIDSPPPPGCEKLTEDDYSDMQDTGFNLAREGTWAMLKHDDLASDKVAAMMPGDYHEWATQQSVGVTALDPEATYGVYVSIRCEKLGDEGLGFTSGIYDIKNKTSLGMVSVDCKDIKSDKYETYKLGSTKLHDQIYLWAAPPKNPANMKAVWVDRFWLVKEK